MLMRVNNYNIHTPSLGTIILKKMSHIGMYSSGPSNGNDTNFVMGGGGKFFHACMTYWSIAFSNW